MNADLFFLALNDIHDRYVMEALTYQAPAKRIIRPILRGLAAACLAVIIGFSAVMAISVEAREMVFGWIREQVDNFTKYTYEEPPANMETEPAEATEAAAYEMTLIPEGYNLFYHDANLGYICDTYADAEGHMLHFTYCNSTEGLTMFKTDDTTMYTAQVHGCEADIYMANDPDAVGSVIVWIENDILFSISGFFDMDTLIELAESVAVRPKEYALGYIPEGYEPIQSIRQDGYSLDSYGNMETGNLLHFVRIQGSEDWDSYVKMSTPPTIP